jgi:hypothetical protein
MEGDWGIMATISNIGKIAYIFNDGVWYPVAGMTDTTANFNWTGDHDFNGAVILDGATTVNGSVVAKNSINFFTSAANRDAAIPTPPNGTVAYVVVNSVAQPQIYFGGQWNIFGNNAYLDEKTSSYTLAMADAGRTIDLNFSTSGTVTVPLNSNVAFPVGTQIAFVRSGAGGVAFAGQVSGLNSVTILSKNNNKSIAARYTQAILVKKAENTWYLFGDLTA